MSSTVQCVSLRRVQPGSSGPVHLPRLAFPQPPLTAFLPYCRRPPLCWVQHATCVAAAAIGCYSCVGIGLGLSPLRPLPIPVVLRMLLHFLVMFLQYMTGFTFAFILPFAGNRRDHAAAVWRRANHALCSSTAAPVRSFFSWVFAAAIVQQYIQPPSDRFADVC